MGQAKLRKNEINQLKQNGPKPKLIGFYWGYNAKNLGEGFEFNCSSFDGQAIDKDLIYKMGNAIYNASQTQLKGVLEKDPQILEGHTVEEFIDQEQARLDLIVEQMKLDGYRCDLETLFHRAMVACCAITTLVAVGRIPQDEYNGDKFFFSHDNKMLVI